MMLTRRTAHVGPILIAWFLSSLAFAACHGADPDPPAAEGSVAEAWQGFEDDGGDTAYAAEVGDRTVLVYGSASPADLQDLIERLTTEPVAD